MPILTPAVASLATIRRHYLGLAKLNAERRVIVSARSKSRVVELLVASINLMPPEQNGLQRVKDFSDKLATAVANVATVEI